MKFFFLYSFFSINFGINFLFCASIFCMRYEDIPESSEMGHAYLESSRLVINNDHRSYVESFDYVSLKSADDRDTITSHFGQLPLEVQDQIVPLIYKDFNALRWLVKNKHYLSKECRAGVHALWIIKLSKQCKSKKQRSILRQWAIKGNDCDTFWKDMAKSGLWGTHLTMSRDNKEKDFQEYLQATERQEKEFADRLRALKLPEKAINEYILDYIDTRIFFLQDVSELEKLIKNCSNNCLKYGEIIGRFYNPVRCGCAITPLCIGGCITCSPTLLYMGLFATLITGCYSFFCWKCTEIEKCNDYLTINYDENFVDRARKELLTKEQ